MSTAKLEKKLAKLEVKLRAEFQADLKKAFQECIARLERSEAKLASYHEEDSASFNIDALADMIKRQEENPEKIQEAQEEVPEAAQEEIPSESELEEEVEHHSDFEPVPFMESTWNVVLVMGLTDAGRLDELLGILLMLCSAVVQVMFGVVLLSRDFQGAPFENNLESASRWRRSLAHSHLHMDLAETSLVSRVCNIDESLIVSVGQASLLGEINSFLGMAKQDLARPDFAPGLWLSMLCVMLWCLFLCQEFRSIWLTVEAVLGIPIRKLTAFKDGRFDHISRGRWLLFMLTRLVRAVIAGVLLYGGVLFLASTTSIRDLMLNAVGLGIIMEVDEMIFNSLMPVKMQNAIQKLESIPVRFSRRRSQVEAIALLLLMVGLLVWPYFTYIEPLTSLMLQVKQVYCGGDQNFVVGLNTGQGVIFARSTLPFNSQVESNVSRTEREVMEYAFGGSSAFLQFEDNSNFEMRRSESLADTTSRVLACEDFDMWFVEGQGLDDIRYLDFYRVYWNTVLDDLGFQPGATCVEMEAFCHDSKLLRLVCSRTCGCGDVGVTAWFMVEEQGCPRVCKRDGFKLLSQKPCADMGKNEDKWHDLWTAYPASIARFAGFANDTLKLEDLIERGDQMIEAGCGALARNGEQREELVTGTDLCDGFHRFYAPLKELCPVACGCLGQSGNGCPGSCACYDNNQALLADLPYAPLFDGVSSCSDAALKGLCSEAVIRKHCLVSCGVCTPPQADDEEADDEAEGDDGHEAGGDGPSEVGDDGHDAGDMGDDDGDDAGDAGDDDGHEAGDYGYAAAEGDEAAEAGDGPDGEDDGAA